MNNIAVPDDRAWPLQPYAPQSAIEGRPGQRVYSATNILDFSTFIRILQHWKWLILGAVALGIAGGILFSLMTTPIYRAWVTLEVNPPTVSVNDEQSRQREQSIGDSYEFVVTQAGLLQSQNVAQRTAQELNLANNPDVVPMDADASTRLKIAAGTVQGGLNVVEPKEGTLIRFSYDSPSPQLAGQVANGVASTPAVSE